jgi:hypothetical protein
VAAAQETPARLLVREPAEGQAAADGSQEQADEEAAEVGREPDVRSAAAPERQGDARGEQERRRSSCDQGERGVAAGFGLGGRREVIRRGHLR